MNKIRGQVSSKMQAGIEISVNKNIPGKKSHTVVLLKKTRE